jgi:hypothetical protein
MNYVVFAVACSLQQTEADRLQKLVKKFAKYAPDALAQQQAQASSTHLMRLITTA